MRQFWWVNHNQTARQEIEGQYLWSPKRENNGARSEFYNNMRRADPDDLVLSYSDQAIRYIGRVIDFAFTAPKPVEFGTRGANWGQEGWLLPVFWTPLTPSVRPRAIIETLGPLLPSRYSPIQPHTGTGNQKAYLANISEAAFNAVVERAAFDRAALQLGETNSLTFEAVTDLLGDAIERQVRSDLALEDTVKRSVVLARRGQGVFRANVEKVEYACRLTGITNPALLVASHIKPWRLCSTAQERLDGYNGLLLTPDADHLFDCGFITFSDLGEVIRSSRIDDDDLQRLGFEALLPKRQASEAHFDASPPTPFKSPQHPYLAYHRSEIFIS